jgi:hypothetical protein
MNSISAFAAPSGARLPPAAAADVFKRMAASTPAPANRVTISAAGRQAALLAQQVDAVTVFAKMDSNHDGKLNSAEFDAAAGSRPARDNTTPAPPVLAAVKAYGKVSDAA